MKPAIGIIMPNTTTAFPNSQQDVALLKQTAIDAAADLSSTAAVHATKAKGQLQDLAGHVQEEGSEQLDQIRGKLSTVVGTGRDFVAANPLGCIAAAVTIGFILGLSRRGSRE
jgi:ElaB/YqjD/DUF883 family membrane-anchored ribosome-binding protein